MPIKTRPIITVFCIASVLLMPAAPCVAEQGQPDFEIPKTHIEVRVIPPDAVPKPELIPKDAQGGTESATPDDPMEAMRQEVENLRDELRMLQATLNLMVNQIMEDLREENTLLRQEVRRLHALREQQGLPDMSALPRPGAELFDALLEEAVQQAEASPQTETPVEEEYYTDEPFDFVPLHQWGRTPEMAEELGGEASSLLGLVGVVPKGSRREDIEQLGRELRAEHDRYDNINIEVFDNLEAAEQFIETQVGDPARRVLSVSKHRGEGRDIILYLHNGEAHEVSP